MKNLPANAGDVKDVDLNPGSGRSATGGHGNPLHSPRGCKESNMIVLSCVQFFATLWTVACQAPLYSYRLFIYIYIYISDQSLSRVLLFATP